MPLMSALPASGNLHKSGCIAADDHSIQYYHSHHPWEFTMSTLLHDRRVIFALCCVFGLIHAACAAEDSDTEELVLVITTPTRTKISISDAPAAVTVVTAKDIKTKNASRLGDALDQVPSLYLRDGALGQSQGTSGTSGMSLR